MVPRDPSARSTDMSIRPFAWISAIAFFAVLATSLMPAAQAGPQDAQKAGDSQAWKLSVGSNLVLVPVVVTDKRGENVVGLHAEDFEIKEDGSVQKIAGLE